MPKYSKTKTFLKKLAEKWYCFICDEDIPHDMR